MRMKRFSRLRYVLLGLTTGMLLCLIAYVSVAGTPAKRGSDITSVKVVDGYSSGTSSGSYVNVSGATEKVLVRQGEQAILIANFTASSRCRGDSDVCALRIMVDGVEAQPAAGDIVYGFAFDSAEVNDGFESHATHRSLGPLPPGSYRVKVQIAVQDPDTDLDLGYWSLIIERVEV